MLRIVYNYNMSCPLNSGVIINGISHLDMNDWCTNFAKYLCWFAARNTWCCSQGCKPDILPHAFSFATHERDDVTSTHHIT
jgi:hypothetical protein